MYQLRKEFIGFEDSTEAEIASVTSELTISEMSPQILAHHTLVHYFLFHFPTEEKTTKLNSIRTESIYM